MYQFVQRKDGSYNRLVCSDCHKPLKEYEVTQAVIDFDMDRQGFVIYCRSCRQKYPFWKIPEPSKEPSLKGVKNAE